ncbi:hypothetical protein RJ639_037162 [Escallonia herrerae]|uniref:Transcription elongation factor SPT5 n=1 Tax=Escallonia herrerae TaxID=1293975 RepID=A0AA88X4S7_9ASTE|nr:hypothetical protein RJ639_037162 [Escallonia herrerae]
MDASMKILTGQFYRLSRPFYVHVDREHLSDNVNVSTPYRDSRRYGLGSETRMHPSRTPLHPYMTPMRDPGATPIHDGMRTPMHDRAWNPYTTMSPPRAPGENANPPSWGSSPQYQPGRPPSRTYDAPTPGGEAGTPRDISPAYVIAPRPYLPSTPGGQPPMTPSSAYLPGTPGGQPMTPGSGGLDIMSTVVGGDSEGPWFLPDILVNVRRSGEETAIGVVREVLPDGSCRVALGSSGNGETVTSLPNEIEIVVPRRSDKIKIMGGAQRGATGKLIRVDGMDGIVKSWSTFTRCLPSVKETIPNLPSPAVACPLRKRPPYLLAMVSKKLTTTVLVRFSLVHNFISATTKITPQIPETITPKNEKDGNKNGQERVKVSSVGISLALDLSVVL